MRTFLDDADAPTLAGLLIGGVLKSELGPVPLGGLRWQGLDDDDLVLRPLPNTLFQRDNSAWIGAGVTVNPMAKLARQRESVHTRAVYRYHPMFRDGDASTATSATTTATTGPRRWRAATCSCSRPASS